MRRALLIALLDLMIAACKSDHEARVKDDPSRPAVELDRTPAGSSGVPVGGSYAEMIESTQSGSAVETRHELACAKTFTEQAAAATEDHTARRPKAASDESFESEMKRLEAREAMLAAMSRDELVRKAEPDELAQTVTQRVMEAASTDRSHLTGAEQDIYVLSLFTGEVLNGGLHQFFFNSSGDEALEVRAALSRIGPPELVPLYDCALTAFPNAKPSKDRDVRNGQLSRWGKRQFEIFDALDRTFFRMKTVGPATAAYVAAHIAEFPSALKPSAAGR